MKIDLSAVSPRMPGSRGTPSKFVLYSLKDVCAKFGAFTRFVTIFVIFDANGLDYTYVFMFYGQKPPNIKLNWMQSKDTLTF